VSTIFAEKSGDGGQRVVCTKKAIDVPRKNDVRSTAFEGFIDTLVHIIDA
jgi:hypothetical protein